MCGTIPETTPKFVSVFYREAEKKRERLGRKEICWEEKKYAGKKRNMLERKERGWEEKKYAGKKGNMLERKETD
jgi:hypothetical protein